VCGGRRILFCRTTMPAVRPLRRTDRLGPYHDVGAVTAKSRFEDTEYDARMTKPLLLVARMAKEIPYWAHFAPFVNLCYEDGHPYLYVSFLATPTQWPMSVVVGRKTHFTLGYIEGCPRTIYWLYEHWHLLKDVMTQHLPVGQHLVLAHRVHVSPVTGAVVIIPHWATHVTAALLAARDAVFNSIPFFLRRDISWANVALHSQFHPTFAVMHASDRETDAFMDYLTMWNVHQHEQGNVRSFMW